MLIYETIKIICSSPTQRAITYFFYQKKTKKKTKCLSFFVRNYTELLNIDSFAL